MGVIIVSKGKPGDDEHLHNLTEYICDDRKLMISGNGLNYTNPDSAYRQMNCVREYYDKIDECPHAQIIVAYGKKVDTNEQVCEFTKKAGEFFDDGYQHLECAHQPDKEEPNFHSHVLVNPINLNTGRQINTNREYMDKFSKYMTKVTGERYIVKFKHRNEE